MPLDPALVAETRAWLIKARRDLDAADFEMTAMPPFTGDAVFHAQQVAEKTLKAFLVWHGRIFRKTHNLVELGEACTTIESSLEPLLRRAARSQSGVYPYCGTFGATIRVGYSCSTYVPPPPDPNTCQGYCFGIPPDSTCSCEVGCYSRGDCCPDYQQICCDPYPQWNGCLQ